MTFNLNAAGFSCGCVQVEKNRRDLSDVVFETNSLFPSLINEIAWGISLLGPQRAMLLGYLRIPIATKIFSKHVRKLCFPELV